MRSLTFIHLAVHHALVNLRSLTLEILEELPAFTSLPKLERLDLIMMNNLVDVPDLASVLPRLLGSVIAYRCLLCCCNGFLGTKCDLSRPSCTLPPEWNFPAPTCVPVNRTDKIATKTTRAAFSRFPMSECSDAVENSEWLNTSIYEDDVKTYDGTLYRQCLTSRNVRHMLQSAHDVDFVRLEPPLSRKAQVVDCRESW